MKKESLVILVLLVLGLSSFYGRRTSVLPVPDMSVAELEEKLGGEINPNRPNTDLEGVSPETGRKLIFEGKADPPGSILQSSRRISKYFTCNACHNSRREDPDLADIDPADRLQYAIDNDIPYLPGSTFWGIVNRKTFYNGDYYKKYGQLVVPTRENLREAVQLCATECSQGRLLEDWELESIMAYFWELGLQVDDLNLDSAEMHQLNTALNSPTDRGNREEALDMLQSKYPQRYPATFSPPPGTREERLHVSGDPHRGEQIYKLSCQHCHYRQNFSYLLLDDSEMTFRYLYKHIPDYDKKSIYQVIRYGTPPLSGKHAYMPQYTLQKLSPDQVTDLVTYIALKAGKL